MQELNIKYMNIRDLKPYKKNAKKHNKEQVEQIANSIKEFGFTQPVIIDFPQTIKLDAPIKVKRKAGSNGKSESSPLKYSGERISEYTERYPVDILKFNRDKGFHPTQKPVDLLSYLIKTYSNEGETVLDFTMGSGSTGVACMETGRKFIGIELDEHYFKISCGRVKQALEYKNDYGDW